MRTARTRPATAFVLLVITVASSRAAAQTPPADTKIILTGFRPSTGLVYEVDGARVDGAPQWDQRTSPEPPLSMNGAIRAATTWLHTKRPDITRFEIGRVDLLRIRTDSRVDPAARFYRGWYYRVGLFAFDGKRRLPGGDEFTVLLLLDGSVVEPSTGTAGAPDTGVFRPFPLTGVTPGVVHRDGTKAFFEISPERATKLPKWDQEKRPDLPLSMSAARSKAESWLLPRNPDIKTFELNGMSLSWTGTPGTPCQVGCWSYQMGFDPIVGDQLLPVGQDFAVVVLLDGSIVEPWNDRPADPVTGLVAGTTDIYVSKTGNGVTAPQLLQRTPPVMTQAARSNAVKGVVTLLGIVNTDGTVGNIIVTRPLGYGLDEEAIRSVKQWRFEPGRRMGVPVKVQVTFDIGFTTR